MPIYIYNLGKHRVGDINVVLSILKSKYTNSSKIEQIIREVRYIDSN